MIKERPGLPVPDMPLALAATGMEAELELWIEGERKNDVEEKGKSLPFPSGLFLGTTRNRDLGELCVHRLEGKRLF